MAQQASSWLLCIHLFEHKGGSATEVAWECEFDKISGVKNQYKNDQISGSKIDMILLLAENESIFHP